MRLESFINQIIKDPVEQAKVFHGGDKKTLALLTAIHRDIVEPMSKSCLRMAEGIDHYSDSDNYPFDWFKAREIQKETASMVEKLRGKR